MLAVLKAKSGLYPQKKMVLQPGGCAGLEVRGSVGNPVFPTRVRVDRNQCRSAGHPATEVGTSTSSGVQATLISKSQRKQTPLWTL